MFAIVVQVGLAIGCADRRDGVDGLKPGSTRFLSADTGVSPGGGFVDVVRGGTGAPGATGQPPRTVEEGDIYRVLAGQQILNLNRYRGLQVIDFSNVSEPRVAGHLPVTGSPVELYVVGERAYVLLNNSLSYHGSRGDVSVERREGGLVLAVDLSDRTKPSMVHQASVPGRIRTSRLTRGGGQAALYVAAQHNVQRSSVASASTWETRTLVKSFDLSQGRLEAGSELNLGGAVSDIQATTEALLVARNAWEDGSDTSSVSIVDISDPTGNMVEGDEVQVSGRVQDKFNMDLHNSVLRIVSGSRWRNGSTNHLETFDASDFSRLKPRRGVIEHGTRVRRSFLADPAITANLSDAELTQSLRPYDTGHSQGAWAPRVGSQLHGRAVVWQAFRALQEHRRLLPVVG